VDKLLVSFAQKVRVKVVDSPTLLSADVTSPRRVVGVAALMEEVECLVREGNAAVDALQPLQAPRRAAGRVVHRSEWSANRQSA